MNVYVQFIHQSNCMTWFCLSQYDYQVIFLDSNMMIIYPECKNNIFNIIHLPGKVLCHNEGEKSVYVSQGWLFKQNHPTTLKAHAYLI